MLEQATAGKTEPLQDSGFDGRLQGHGLEAVNAATLTICVFIAFSFGGVTATPGNISATEFAYGLNRL